MADKKTRRKRSEPKSVPPPLPLQNGESHLGMRSPFLGSACLWRALFGMMKRLQLKASGTLSQELAKNNLGLLLKVLEENSAS